MKDLNYYLNLPYTISVKKLGDEEYFAQYLDIVKRFLKSNNFLLKIKLL
ncbi:hypothetical protein CSUIS_0473 [Campylobacter porcelli]|uniref:Uncharacterized protein n=1 Tax=Campylobacter porcelli TaxID=1660073 RepID=A0A1X9SVL6_9BACT|nr:hypothetical protein [Campylobacter sp. RM6137]ARR00312.1 hypothetical protein CSUIS_0473 [Campylobacter sp. RM6137]